MGDSMMQVKTSSFNKIGKVYGVGNNEGKYRATGNREYYLWKAMLARCYELPRPLNHAKYEGCTVSENFKSYSYFYEWCQSQVGFNSKDEKGKSWHLDKDLLIKGSRLYGEDTCVYVPPSVNFLLTKRESKRGDCCIGVRFHKRDNVYEARCNNGTGASKYLGYYDTEQEAFLAYKSFKESYIKQVANEYSYQLDPRAYQALMNYQVEITD